MKSAFLICTSLGSTDNDRHEATIDGVGRVRNFVEPARLPKLDTVHSALQNLVAAVASNSRTAAVSALEEMGVFALCPVPDEQLLRMEQLARNVSGRPRLVFLVELSLFAVELGNFEAARKYVTEAWNLVPSGWELYNLCILEGFFALEAGKTEEAIQYLEKSLGACQTDEVTLINCGLRPPNFLLAHRLFELGARDQVLKHLMDCRNVWQHRWLPMEEWINLVENGQAPEFDGSEGLKAMSLPSWRLYLQWARILSLKSAKGLSPTGPNSRSPAEVAEAKEKLLAEVDRHISAKVKDEISYLDKGLDAPPTTPSPNPAEPDKPE